MAFDPRTVPVQPIASLSPFMGGKNWIKARVVDKSPIRTWEKPTSSGKLFSCTFVDETAAIRATFFQEAVDRFHPLVDNGKVFYIGGSTVKNANRRFNNVNNEYELTIDSKSELHQATDAATNIPTQRYNFVPISTLATKEEGSPVDILAIVVKVGAQSKIVSKKDQKELTKVDVTFGDSTATVDCTFWNDDALQFNQPVGTVLAIKNVRVKSFQGVVLGYNQSSSIDVEPQLPDAQALKQWAKSGAEAKSLSGQRGAESGSSLGRRYLRQIESEGLGRGEKPDYITIRCVPTFIKTETLFYDACPKDNKKVIDQGNGTHFCSKCNTTVNPTARFMFSMQISDGVTAMWVTMFEDSGATFWQTSADNLKKEMQQNGEAVTKRAQQRLYHPMLLTVRVKEERTQPTDGSIGEDRVRLTGVKIEDFMFSFAQGDQAPQASAVAECRNLIDSIKSFSI